MHGEQKQCSVFIPRDKTEVQARVFDQLFQDAGRLGCPGTVYTNTWIRCTTVQLVLCNSLFYQRFYISQNLQYILNIFAIALAGLERTVAHALHFKSKDVDETKKLGMVCTANFVQLVDRMFDCLNVGNYTDGK